MMDAPIITWKQAPFLRLLLPAIAGIVFQQYLSPSWWFTASLAAIAIITLILLPKASLSLLFRYRIFLSFAMLLLLFAAGALRMFQISAGLQPKGLPQIISSGYTYFASIQEPLSEKPNSFKTVALINGMIDEHHHSSPAKTRLLIYFQRNSTKAAQLNYGAGIAFRKQISPVKATGNPGSFNYQEHLKKEGIHQQVFLTDSDYLITSKPFSYRENFRMALFELRDWINHILTTHIPGEKEAGLAEALLIGYKDDLDKQLIQSYSNTGVIHVIAISGLHLGIIYLLLAAVCKPLAGRKAMKFFRPVFIITGLWLFAILAGASPSVLRSAVMFSCIAIGDSLVKKSSIYNSLAASAFLLLFYNPYWLWDAGFQLSYAAVISIALFQRIIYESITFLPKWKDVIWKLTATTLAAQMLTFPISLFLFHQFPVLFLLTNLIAIPLSSIILLGEILLCLIAAIPLLAKPTGILLGWLIRSMNIVVETVDTIPFASITNLQINLLQLVLLYAAIAAVSVLILCKEKRALYPAIILLMAFFTVGIFNAWTRSRQKMIVVYHLPKRTGIDCIIGDRFISANSADTEADFNSNYFTFLPARNYFGVKKADSLPGLYRAEHFIRMGQQTLLIIDSCFSPETPASSHPIPVDLLLISGNPAVPPGLLLDHLPCKTLVMDGSNSARTLRRWKSHCEARGIPVHSTFEKGAFVLNAY